MWMFAPKRLRWLTNCQRWKKICKLKCWPNCFLRMMNFKNSLIKCAYVVRKRNAVTTCKIMPLQGTSSQVPHPASPSSSWLNHRWRSTPVTRVRSCYTKAFRLLKIVQRLRSRCVLGRLGRRFGHRFALKECRTYLRSSECFVMWFIFFSYSASAVLIQWWWFSWCYSIVIWLLWYSSYSVVIVRLLWSSGIAAVANF